MWSRLGSHSLCAALLGPGLLSPPPPPPQTYRNVTLLALGFPRRLTRRQCGNGEHGTLVLVRESRLAHSVMISAILVRSMTLNLCLSICLPVCLTLSILFFYILSVCVCVCLCVSLSHTPFL